ncbi:MAG: TRAM domain-containing protein, partial [Dehalococcoidia bacterium]
NELAASLKPSVLPGEEMTIHITQEGKEEGQGVGFLDDGTMVVVEGGNQHINSQLPIVITRVLQTSAGRIIFAHLK